ncbi:unnamed protein product [Blepharisma stoltei]|uniref:Uncharacterized protein n=1 Tax=Blepharisma stoltei TaxID=1481888 RepID=A0AAU9JQ77_9CILI|nr:unnamed protein product [Blepharisma stoltei]
MQKSKDKSFSRSSINSAAHQVLVASPILRDFTPDKISRANGNTLQQQIEKLIKENQEKDQIIISLQRNYEGVSKIFKEEKGKTYESNDKIIILEGENSMLQAKVQILETQKFSITRELDKALEDLDKLNKCYEEIRIIKIENQTLKGLIENRKNDIEEVQRKCDIAKGEADALKKVKTDLESSLKKTKSDFDELLQEKNKILEELNSLKQINEDLTHSSKTKYETIERLKTENATYKAREHQLLIQISNLKEKINEEKESHITARGKISELSSAYRELQEQLLIKETLFKAQKNSAEKISELEEIIAKKDSEIENLLKENENLQYLHQKGANDSSRISRESLDIKMEYENYKANIESQNQLSSEKVNSIIKIFMKTEIQCRDLEMEIDILPKDEERRYMDIGILNGELGNRLNYLHNQADELCKDKILLLNELKNSPKGNFISQDLYDLTNKHKNEIETKLKDAEEKIESLNHELLFAKRKAKQAEHFIEKKDSMIASLKETNEKLELDLNEYRNKIEELNKELNQKNKDFEPLVRKLKKKVEKMANLKAELSVLNPRLPSLNEELAKIKAVLSSRNADILSLNSKIKSLNEQIFEEQKAQAQLQRDLAAKSAEIALYYRKSRKKPSGVVESTTEILDRIEYLKDELDKYKPSKTEENKTRSP